MLTPDVVGVNITGALEAGVTSTDLVLHVTQMMRRAKVVGKFVEFFGSGTAHLTVPDRATISNMAVEYGATIGFFPVDEQTCRFLRQTGRPEADVRAVETYYRAQGLFGTRYAAGARSILPEVLTLGFVAGRACGGGAEAPAGPHSPAGTQGCLCVRARHTRGRRRLWPSGG